MANNIHGEKTLGDYVDIIRGTTYKSRLLNRPGPVLLGLSSIGKNGGFRYNSLKTYGGDSPDKLLVNPGELYVSLKDVTQSGDLLGSVARVPPTMEAGRLTQDTVKLIPKFSTVNLGFLYWVLRSPQYREYCRQHAIGTTNLSISREDFLSFPIPQETSFNLTLVDILEYLESKIELNRRMNETLEAMARAIFKSWFVDFDPVRAKAEGRDPGLPSHIADLFPSEFEDSELGEIPMGWKISTLAEQFDAVRGLSYKGQYLCKAGEGIPMHNLNSVYEGGGYKHEGLKWYRGNYRAAHLLVPGDVIVTNTEQGFDYLLIGYPAIVPNRYGPRGLFSHHIYRVRTKSSAYLPPWYLYLLLRTHRFHDLVAGYSNGTTVNMLPLDGIQKPSLVLPPLNVINVYEKLFKNIHERIELIENENASLSYLRNTILPKLISGDMHI